MGLSKSDQAGLIEYWVDEAEEALEVAGHLIEKGITRMPFSLATWRLKKF